MLLTVLAGFVALVVAELYVIVLVARATSVALTVLLLVVTSFVGAALVRREGSRTLRRLRQTVNSGRSPTGPIIDGGLLAVGGALLLVPGFITDALGLLLVFPLTRIPFRGLLALLILRRGRRGRSRQGRRNRSSRREAPTVIEGEVIDQDPSEPPPGDELPGPDRRAP
jgi:UPF0716 protein FxsA